jgi:hypothetical protein
VSLGAALWPVLAQLHSLSGELLSGNLTRIVKSYVRTRFRMVL